MSTIKGHTISESLQNDILQWDVKAWSRALNFWTKNLNLERSGPGLELGAREGGLSLWMALNGMNVVCSDRENTVETALPLHERYAVQHKIHYQDIDATAIPFENHFDVVIFKSILGGIGASGGFVRQKRAIEEMHKALKPGGMLMFAENLSGSFLHRFFRKRFVSWGNSWRYLNQKELKDSLHIFSKVELRCAGVIGTFGRNETQRKCLTRVDDMLLNRICPAKWKYIGYGVAIK